MITYTRLTVSLLMIALLAISFVHADDIKVDDPDVTVLTDANFEEFIAGDLQLVEFYAPWCGHCKSLAPEYAVAATQLKADGVKLGKVDATVQTKIAGQFSISGYPTLKIFRNGKPSDYNGPRKTDGIVQYMRKQVGPAAKPITTDADLQKLLKADEKVGYVVVGFFNEDKVSQLQSSFGLLANRMRDEFVFARTTDAELKKKYGVDGEALIAFLHGEQTVYDGASKQADVEAFIRNHSLPAVGEYSEATANIYQGRKLPVAKLFINVDRKPGSKTMTYFTNRLKKLATKFEGKVLIAYADRVGQKGQLEHLNMQDEENAFVIDDLPNNKQYKFDPEEDEDAPKKKKGGLDVEGWIKFVEEFLAGDATVYVKSQKAPKNNLKNPVKVATGNNFDDLVNQDDKDVMIEFYAPWCGHCKALEPKYEALGKKLQDKENVIIAKIDATANEYDRQKWSVSGYPTVFFKPAGKKATVYEGARETDAMYEYIKKNGKTFKKKKNKKSKKAKRDEEDDE